MNTFFQFKKFIIHQDKCAMKVCTDACLFGAYVANKLEADNFNLNKILDIGAGTGLLSLMLAQKCYEKIDAIELDENAFLQARKNIENSPFRNQIEILNVDILTFSANEKYDLIICNPPFFENQLKSDTAERNAAMHATTLSLLQLVQVIKSNLTLAGKAYLLLPYYAIANFEKNLFENKLFI